MSEEWMFWRYSLVHGWSRFDPRTLVAQWDETKDWLEQLGLAQRSGSFDPVIWEVDNAEDYEHGLFFSVYARLGIPMYFVDTGDWEIMNFFVDDAPSLLTIAPLMRALQETADPSVAWSIIMTAEYSSEDGKRALKRAADRRREYARMLKRERDLKAQEKNG